MQRRLSLKPLNGSLYGVSRNSHDVERVENPLETNPTVTQEYIDRIMTNYTGGDDEQQFLNEIFLFHYNKGTPILKLPKFGKRPLNIHFLYVQVIKYGGLQEALGTKDWKAIVNAYEVPISFPSASSALRNHYKKYLLEYEHYKLRGVHPIKRDMNEQDVVQHYEKYLAKDVKKKRPKKYKTKGNKNKSPKKYYTKKKRLYDELTGSMGFDETAIRNVALEQQERSHYLKSRNIPFDESNVHYLLKKQRLYASKQEQTWVEQIECLAEIYHFNNFNSEFTSESINDFYYMSKLILNLSQSSYFSLNKVYKILDILSFFIQQGKDQEKPFDKERLELYHLSLMSLFNISGLPWNQYEIAQSEVIIKCCCEELLNTSNTDYLQDYHYWSAKLLQILLNVAQYIDLDQLSDSLRFMLFKTLYSYISIESRVDMNKSELSHLAFKVIDALMNPLQPFYKRQKNVVVPSLSNFLYFNTLCKFDRGQIIDFITQCLRSNLLKNILSLHDDKHSKAHCKTLSIYVDLHQRIIELFSRFLSTFEIPATEREQFINENANLVSEIIISLHEKVSFFASLSSTRRSILSHTPGDEQYFFKVRQEFKKLLESHGQLVVLLNATLAGESLMQSKNLLEILNMTSLKAPTVLSDMLRQLLQG